MFPGNNGGGPRPLSKKKTVQFLILLTILAWATQTLFHQWGYGQAPTMSEEKFVPGSSRFAAGATLEMRVEATVVGTEVKLKQVCRWSDSDASVFAPIADLTLIRLGQKVPFRSIGVDDIRTTLRDAGVNIAAINFVGSTACTVARSDVEFNEGEALQKWIDAREPAGEPASAGGSADATPALASAAIPATQPTVEPLAAELAPYHNLRDLLTQDLAVRLGLPVETMQMSFSPQDERLLNLSEPHFKFQIDGQRARGLGEVSWNVTIFATDNTRQRATVGATARAWQNQLVVAKPMNAKQLITDADVVQRRTLVDRTIEDTVLDKPQAIGQQASRDIKPGTVLTARLVDAVQLVRPGQFVTVVYQQGSVELKTVARALEGGSFGQTIRVKNETTRDIFNVILTGPQTASMTSPVPRASENPNVASARE